MQEQCGLYLGGDTEPVFTGTRGECQDHEYYALTDAERQRGWTITPIDSHESEDNLVADPDLVQRIWIMAFAAGAAIVIVGLLLLFGKR